MSEFKFFRFNQSVGLSFSTMVNGTPVWEESQRYYQDSVHVFKAEIGKYGDYFLTTPEGRLIPGVPSHLLTEVDAFPSPPSPKQVLESFPAPVPGEKGILDGAWSCPYAFNSLRVLRDPGVPGSLLDCSSPPVAYLRLEKNIQNGHWTKGSYVYRCSFFGVASANKLVKV